MKKKKYLFIFIPLYIILILWYTVLGRGLSPKAVSLDLFWSYREWFTEKSSIGFQILANIVLFIPLGFMLASVCRKCWKAIFIAFLLSCVIEFSQLLTMRGLFEFDDIFNNTLGGMIGTGVYAAFGEKQICDILSIAAALGFTFVCYYYSPPVDSTPRVCGFQIDEDLTGFFLIYNHDTPEEYSIYLKRTTGGQKINPEVQYGIQRPDVDDYFSCEFNYSHCGFQIHEVPETGDYEFVVRYKPFVTFHTGVYLDDGRICYVKPSSLHQPALKEVFIDNGYLRVNRPDYHCWVYQYKGSLYWVVDEDFNFEEDGSTYIQFQLWTTQHNKLPRHRLEHEWYWDNIGSVFEDHELEGDFGEYRVMRLELPTEYSITAIITGYYQNHRWVWSEYFRPVYDF